MTEADLLFYGPMALFTIGTIANCIAHFAWYRGTVREHRRAKKQDDLQNSLDLQTTICQHITVNEMPNGEKPKETEMKVSAKKTDGPSVEVDFNFGNNLAETVNQFGEDTVYKAVVAALKVQFQAWLRAQATAGKAADEIQQELNNKGWKPGERRAGKSPQDKLRGLLDAMTPEERAAFIKDFKAKAA